MKDDNFLMVAAQWLIFAFRHALTALYVIMTVASFSYLVHAGWETGVFAVKLWSSESGDNIVGVLTLLDDMMITSLLFLIIGGSFLVYVRSHLHDKVFVSDSDRPPAFKHLSPTTLKTKMSAALVGVSAVLIIRLLVEALRVDATEMDMFIKRVVIAGSIHLVLVISCFVFYRMQTSEDGAEAKAEHSTPTEIEAAHHA